MRETMIAGLAVGLLGTVLPFFGGQTMDDYRERAAIAARAAMQAEKPEPPAMSAQEAWQQGFMALPPEKRAQIALLFFAQQDERKRRKNPRAYKPEQHIMGQVVLARLRTEYALEACADQYNRDTLSIALSALISVEARLTAEIERKKSGQGVAA